MGLRSCRWVLPVLHELIAHHVMQRKSCLAKDEMEKELILNLPSIAHLARYLCRTVSKSIYGDQSC